MGRSVTVSPAMLLTAEFLAMISFAVIALGLVFLWRPTTAVGWILFLTAWLWWQRFAASAFETTTIVPLGYKYAKLEKKKPLKGKTCVITGANAGIGYETAVQMARLGANLVITCRSRMTCKATEERIRRAAALPAAASADQNSQQQQQVIASIELELGDLESIRRFPDAYRALKLGPIFRLIHNAGALLTASSTVTQTKDGFEPHIGCNFLGPLLLTDLLRDELTSRLANEPSRVVHLSSLMHRAVRTEQELDGLMEEYRMKSTPLGKVDMQEYFALYGWSKLGNLLLGRYMALPGAGFDGVESVSLHPGCVATDFAKDIPLVKFFNRVLGDVVFSYVYRSLCSLFFKLQQEGSYTSITCVMLPKVRNGWYYTDSRPAAAGEMTALAKSDDIARKMVDWGRAQIKIASQA